VTSAHVSEQRGRQLEQANKELQQISSRLMTVQDIEQRRIARELHDGVGQYLAAIKMSCDVALLSSTNGEESAALQDALNVLERCTADVRTMSHLLHPPLLEEMGLASAIPWYVDGFIERSGIDVKVHLPPDLERLPALVELTVFRLIQESLTNIHRHSGSQVALIRLMLKDDVADLTIEDRGKGFGSHNGQPVKVGVGVASMRERVRELGGELRINSTNSGTVLQAVLPCAREARWQSESLS